MTVTVTGKTLVWMGVACCGMVVLLLREWLSEKRVANAE
jgi:hypothetical protein